MTTNFFTHARLAHGYWRAHEWGLDDQGFLRLIHQALDRHRDFATQVALDDETANLITDALHLGIAQVASLPRRSAIRPL